MTVHVSHQFAILTSSAAICGTVYEMLSDRTGKSITARLLVLSEMAAPYTALISLPRSPVIRSDDEAISFSTADLIMGCLARFRPVCAWAPTILAWGHADIGLSCVTFLIRWCISVSFAEIRPRWLDVEYSLQFLNAPTYNNLIVGGRMCL